MADDCPECDPLDGDFKIEFSLPKMADTDNCACGWCDDLGIRHADEVDLGDFQQITISSPGFEPRTFKTGDGVMSLGDVIREAFRYPAN